MSNWPQNRGNFQKFPHIHQNNVGFNGFLIKKIVLLKNQFQQTLSRAAVRVECSEGLWRWRGPSAKWSAIRRSRAPLLNERLLLSRRSSPPANCCSPQQRRSTAVLLAVLYLLGPFIFSIFHYFHYFTYRVAFYLTIFLYIYLFCPATTFLQTYSKFILLGVFQSELIFLHFVLKATSQK